jgi:hypothetical protein
VEVRLVVREVATPSLLVRAGATGTSSSSGTMGAAAAGATTQVKVDPRGGMQQRRQPHKDLGRTRPRLSQPRATAHRSFINSSVSRGNRLMVMSHALTVVVMHISLLVVLLFAVRDVGN